MAVAAGADPKSVLLIAVRLCLCGFEADVSRGAEVDDSSWSGSAGAGAAGGGASGVELEVESGELSPDVIGDESCSVVGEGNVAESGGKMGAVIGGLTGNVLEAGLAFCDAVRAGTAFEICEDGFKVEWIASLAGTTFDLRRKVMVGDAGFNPFLSLKARFLFTFLEAGCAIVFWIKGVC